MLNVWKDQSDNDNAQQYGEVREPMLTRSDRRKPVICIFGMAIFENR